MQEWARGLLNRKCFSEFCFSFFLWGDPGETSGVKGWLCSLTGGLVARSTKSHLPSCYQALSSFFYEERTRKGERFLEPPTPPLLIPSFSCNTYHYVYTHLLQSSSQNINMDSMVRRYLGRDKRVKPPPFRILVSIHKTGKTNEHNNTVAVPILPMVAMPTMRERERDRDVSARNGEWTLLRQYPQREGVCVAHLMTQCPQRLPTNKHDIEPQCQASPRIV